MNHQPILIVLVLLLMTGGVILYSINPGEKICEERQIPIKLVDVQAGNNELSFTYEWTGKNNNLSIVAAQFNVKEFATNINEFTPIILNKHDLVIINHTGNNKDIVNLEGTHTLFFKQTDTGCIQNKTKGVYLK